MKSLPSTLKNTALIFSKTSVNFLEHFISSSTHNVEAVSCTLPGNAFSEYTFKSGDGSSTFC